MPLREILSGIEVWPEGNRWRWEVVRFSDRGTQPWPGHRGERGGRPSGRTMRAARGWLWLAAAAVVATTIAVMVWLMS